MKRLLILSCFFIAAGALLMQLIRTDSGYVLVSIGTYTLEMSFWFALSCALIFIVLLRWGFSSLRRIKSTLTSGASWFSYVRQKNVDRHTHQGLIYFIEGNWRAAKKELLRAAKKSDQPLVHYLAAARSAHELGLSEETQFLLHQAETLAPQNELAIALSQARMQLSDGHYEQCLATLSRARDKSPKHPVILDLLRRVYWQLGDWSALIDLLPDLRSSDLFSDREYVALEKRIFLAYLSAQSMTQSDEERLENHWKNLPKKYQKDPDLVAVYCQLLIKFGAQQKVEDIIRRTLARDWYPALVELYGRIAADDAQTQLLTAEQWLREHPGDATLLLALGRISYRNELWGKARDYLQKSLQLKEQASTYAELAKLMAQLGEHEKSTELYQRGLVLKTA